MPINQLIKGQTPVVILISLKLYSPIFREGLLLKLHQIGICSFYHNVADVISDWAAVALQAYKDSNQVILLKLWGWLLQFLQKQQI